jgi:probable selenium-dependent hydroxylase accessory protein YqeC
MLGDRGVISLVGAGGKTSLMFKLAHELSVAGASVLTTTTTRIYEPRPDQSRCVVVSDSIAELLDEARRQIDGHRHISMACHRLPDEGKLAGLTPESVDSIWKRHLFAWIIVEADGAAGRPLKAPAVHEPVIPGCTSYLVGFAGLSGVGQPLNDHWIFRPDHFAKVTGLPHNSLVTENAVAELFTHPEGLFKSAPDHATRIAFLNQADTPEKYATGQRIARRLTAKASTGLKRVIIGQLWEDSPVLEIKEVRSGVS